MRKRCTEVPDRTVAMGLTVQRGVPEESWRNVPEEKLPLTCHG